MELGASVSVSVLASCELAEVAGGYWYNIVIELEYDTAFVFVVNCNIELVDCDDQSASISYLAVEEKAPLHAMEQLYSRKSTHVDVCHGRMNEIDESLDKQRNIYSGSARAIGDAPRLPDQTRGTCARAHDERSQSNSSSVQVRLQHSEARWSRSCIGRAEGESTWFSQGWRTLMSVHRS